MASSSLDVFLRLHGQRKFAKEVEASGAELEAMGVKGAAAMASFARKAESLKKFGRSWTHNVSLPVAGLGIAAGYMAVNFRRQMGLVATDAGGTAKEVGRLEHSVLGLARHSQFGPQQLAESLFHVESSGYRASRAMKVLNASQKLATTGNSDLQSTTYALVSATKSLYGESLKNVNRTAAELNGIVAHGDVRLEELTAAMATGVIPKAKSMGLGLRDVGAALDVMTRRGIPAQRAAYALGFTMQKLVPYTEKAEEAFEAIGLGPESLVKASKGSLGYVHTLEVLKVHLAKAFPGKQALQTKMIEEMFGGGRMTSGLLTDMQNLGEMRKVYGELGDEVQIYQRHVKEAENQPLVKLKRAWSNISASLTEIGGSLLPVAVPALQNAAHFASALGKDFAALPGPVKELGIGFLVLTGPVASGLGYFASGIGRSLILTKKLIYAGKALGGFSWGMGQGFGIKGSAAYALRGSGIAAALQTAKGFAVGIGPAVAAAGIGSIVISATQGEWKKVGFEGGGALVGGMAAVLTGNPELAPLGAGLGVFAGKLVSGFFGGKKTLSPMRRELEHLAGATQGYKRILKTLPAAQKGARSAAERHARALRGEKAAEHKLTGQIREFGRGSRQAAEAQLGLDRAEKKVTKSAIAQRRAHRLAGAELRLFRMRSLEHVAAIKQLLPLERKHARLLGKEERREPHNQSIVKENVHILRLLKGQEAELVKAYATAEAKGGRPWAKRLEGLTTLQAKYGAKGHVLVERLAEQKSHLHQLNLMGLKGIEVWRELKEEIGETSREIRRFNRSVPAPFGPHHQPHHGRHLQHHRHGAASHHRANKRESLINIPRHPKRVESLGSGSASLVSGGETTIRVPVELDGQVLTEAVARHVQKKASRQ